VFDARQFSGPYLAWAELANSGLRRRMLHLATLASVTTAGALAGAAIPDARVGVFAAAAVALLAAIAAWWHSAREIRPMQLQIDAKGEIRVRPGEVGTGELLRAVYVSNWQVVLASKSGSIAVWSDTLSAAAFRRLVVLSRWGLDRRAGPRTDVQDGGQDSGRGGGRDGGKGHRPIGQSTPAQSEAAN